MNSEDLAGSPKEIQYQLVALLWKFAAHQVTGLDDLNPHLESIGFQLVSGGLPKLPGSTKH